MWISIIVHYFHPFIVIESQAILRYVQFYIIDTSFYSAFFV